LVQDLRYGIRVLRNSPGFTAAAVFTLALGIAVNTTVFGWIDGLLMHPFPGVSGGDRLSALETVSPTGEFSTTSWRDYRDYRDGLTLTSGVAASLFNAFAVGDENPQRVSGEYVSANYFSVLGDKPELGRAFLPAEFADAPGSAPVVVLGHRLWQQRFHGDRAVIGRTLRVNRHELTIIGVAPPEFRGSVPGLALGIWVPMVMAPHRPQAASDVGHRTAEGRHRRRSGERGGGSLRAAHRQSGARKQPWLQCPPDAHLASPHRLAGTS